MKRMHWDHVEMKWEHGEEATCVYCGNRNAMLNTGHLGEVSFYECRDCHVIVASWYKRDEDYRDARIIGRSIGKTCSACGHFVENSSFARRGDKAGYWCRCGQFWGS